MREGSPPASPFRRQEVVVEVVRGCGIDFSQVLHPVLHSQVPIEETAPPIVGGAQSRQEPGRSKSRKLNWEVESRIGTRLISFRAYWY